MALAYQEKLEEVVGHVQRGPAALMAYYKTHTANLTQVCLNLIVADTAAAAQAVQARSPAEPASRPHPRARGVDSESPRRARSAASTPT